MDNSPLEHKLLDFWRWAASDLVGNTARGVLAEYIVAMALGVAEGVRLSWDAFDLTTPSGVKIEVKSAAYLQAWYHKKLSAAIFTIRPTRVWNPDTNELDPEIKRQADLYVFCVLKHKDKASLDPLNLKQWDFYLLPVGVLNARMPVQKTLSLSSLLRLSPVQATYETLRDAVLAMDCRR
ncbi:MAG TPA: hypothetical protein VF826_06175 [Chloroflexia bacterium]